MSFLVLLRHGQSEYNAENRFTGDIDSGLTPKGVREAFDAGDMLMQFDFAIAFSSMLSRSKDTLRIVLEQIRQQDIPVVANAALNERSYGSLQGLNKTEVENIYGVDQVKSWRRSYRAVPPDGESLEAVVKRVVPYFVAAIEPYRRSGQNVLIVAHGNSLRALMMYLEELNDSEIAGVDIATGVPRVYVSDAEMRISQVYDITGPGTP